MKTIINLFYIFLGLYILTMGFCCERDCDVQEEEVVYLKDVLESREFDEVKESFEVVKEEFWVVVSGVVGE